MEISAIIHARDDIVELDLRQGVVRGRADSVVRLFGRPERQWRVLADLRRHLLHVGKGIAIIYDYGYVTDIES